MHRLILITYKFTADLHGHDEDNLKASLSFVEYSCVCLCVKNILNAEI